MPTYYIPLHFQFVRGDSPLGAAVGLLPFIFPMVFCGFANGAAMTKLGYYMPWYLFGGILTALGGGLMSMAQWDPPEEMKRKANGGLFYSHRQRTHRYITHIWLFSIDRHRRRYVHPNGILGSSG